MNNNNDTIASISTAVSESGIGIIRISGPEAFEIADKIYQSKNKKAGISSFADHTIHYGFIVDGEEVIDEVLVSVFYAPHTYTAENTVEVNCHGGVFAMKRVLETVIKAGARIAEPGEFTKRAFLNGRIDLSRAEAVMDVIRSNNEYALQNSMKQLRGAVYEKVSSLRQDILYQCAKIEAALDDPEHYSLDGFSEKLTGKIKEWDAALQDDLRSCEDGRILQEGIRTVILGKPNAGKSSLLNMLTGSDTAIVTEIEGTTRDVLTEKVQLGNLTLLISDTAGIRESKDLVEKIGVERAMVAAKQADLILYVADASVPLDENDAQIIAMTTGRQVLYLLNKSDLPPVTGIEDIRKLAGKGRMKEDPCRVLSISAAHREGLKELKDEVESLFYHGKVSLNNQVIITSQRQKVLLQNALQSLHALFQSVELQMPEDFFTIDMMDACRFLGEITGEETSEDLVDRIFSDFCMGK